MRISHAAFEQSVENAITRLPENFREIMTNLVVLIEERPAADLLDEMGIPPDETLFGLYTGVPLPERSVTEPPLYPDEIVIFREPLLEACRSIEDLEEEIEITVVHEVAHYLGIDDERLAELGYG